MVFGVDETILGLAFHLRNDKGTVYEYGKRWLSQPLPEFQRK